MSEKVKDLVIVGLAIFGSVMATGYYNADKLNRLEEKMEKTESLLKSVNWSNPAIKNWRDLGYDLSFPVPKATEVDTTR